MIAGTNGHLGQTAKFAQVFGDDGDLKFEFEVAGHIQKVSGDDEAVVAIRHLEQPVKLPQVVVKVRCDEQFQSSCHAFTHETAFGSILNIGGTEPSKFIKMDKSEDSGRGIQCFVETNNRFGNSSRSLNGAAN